MNYTVILTEEAAQELEGIYHYIAHELLAPETARKQVARIFSEVRTLETLPDRYKLYEDEPFRSMGIRSFPVGNYLVFYKVDNESRRVYVMRIMYGGRNIRQQLQEHKTKSHNSDA